MNNLTKTIKFSAFAIFLLLFIFSCKKKTDEPAAEDAPIVKKLDKTTIYPKIWYTQGSSTIHNLKNNGVYGDNGGTWKWIGTSDTMEIVSKSGLPPTEWKVFWNTEHEMLSERIGTFTQQQFKDSAW